MSQSVLQIRKRSFGSGLKLVSDLDPDLNPDTNPESNPGFEARIESWIRIQIRNWQKLLFFSTKIFNQPHLLKIKSRLLCFVTWL
jgi:hypothetical protein